MYTCSLTLKSDDATSKQPKAGCAPPQPGATELLQYAPSDLYTKVSPGMSAVLWETAESPLCPTAIFDGERKPKVNWKSSAVNDFQFNYFVHDIMQKTGAMGMVALQPVMDAMASAFCFLASARTACILASTLHVGVAAVETFRPHKRSSQQMRVPQLIAVRCCAPSHTTACANLEWGRRFHRFRRQVAQAYASGAGRAT